MPHLRAPSPALIPIAPPSHWLSPSFSPRPLALTFIATQQPHCKPAGGSYAGMNDKIGLLSYRMDRDAFDKPYSNETARMIDDEVRTCGSSMACGGDTVQHPDAASEPSAVEVCFFVLASSSHCGYSRWCFVIHYSRYSLLHEFLVSTLLKCCCCCS